MNEELLAHFVEDHELIAVSLEALYSPGNTIMVDLLVELNKRGLLVDFLLDLLVDLQPLLLVQQGSGVENLFLQRRAR